MSNNLSEQELVRRESLQKIKDLGINPFPAAEVKVNSKQIAELLTKNKFRVSALLEADLGLTEAIEFDAGVTHDATTLEEFVKGLRVAAMGDYRPEKFPEVHIAGRFMGQRGPFAKLQDSEGRMQLYIKKGTIGETEEEQLKINALVKQLHIGDFIGVKGYLFASQTGEVSVHVQELNFLGKSLKPLPVVKRDKQGNIYDEFKDPELRYRQRYVDLTVNPSVKEIFLKRSKVIKSMRRFFDDKGWLEVETPILQPIHGGAAARPFW